MTKPLLLALLALAATGCEENPHHPDSYLYPQLNGMALEMYHTDSLLTIAAVNGDSGMAARLRVRHHELDSEIQCTESL